MSTEQNKALTQRWFAEVWSKGNVAVVDELLAADYIEHTSTPAGPIPPGSEGFKQVMTMYRAIFPDLCFEPQDIIIEGDKVATRLLCTGTDKGGFAGMPATGKPVSIGGMDIARWQNGKIVEHWGEYDFFGMMAQLGMIPQPEQ